MSDETPTTANNGENTGKDPKTGQFLPGNKLGGKTPGSLDFKTKWRIFVDRVAKDNKMTIDQIDEQLLATAFNKAKKGDYNFYRDIQDRVHGKAPQTIELQGEVTTITMTPQKKAELLALLQHKPKND